MNAKTVIAGLIPNDVAIIANAHTKANVLLKNFFIFFIKSTPPCLLSIF